jgi:NitT/TauT family transport system substrate-binding protein
LFKRLNEVMRLQIRFIGRAFVFAAALLASAVWTGPAAAAAHAVRLGVMGDLMLHLPIYAALEKNFFASENLAVNHVTKFGKFRASISLTNKEADIILQPVEAYFELVDAYGPKKFKIIAGLTATEGSVVIARRPIPVSGFSWNQLRAKRVLGRDKNSTPMYFLRAALVTNAVDPSNINFHTTVAVPARGRIWNNERTHDYAIFYEPDASTIIRRGNGYFAAMPGPAVGETDASVLIVRSEFLETKKNRNLVQLFMNASQRSLNWVAKASVDELVSVVSRYVHYRRRGKSIPVPKADLTSAIMRYRAIGLWKRNLQISPAAITNIQRLIIEGGGTRTKKHLCYDDVVDPRFSDAALAKYPSGVPGLSIPRPNKQADCG